jgi:hypothetical protein
MKPCSFAAHRNTFIIRLRRIGYLLLRRGVQGIRHIWVGVIAIIAKLGGVAFR